MPCRPNKSDDAAPSPPRCITPPQVKSNGGAGDAESDAEGTNAESDSDVEKKSPSRRAEASGAER